MRRIGTPWVAWMLLMAPMAASAAMTTEQRLQMLEEQLRRTQDQLEKSQKEIEQLRGELRQQRAIGQATQQQAEQAEQKAMEVQTAQKSFSLPDALQKFSLFGDFRMRHEGFYNQPTKEGSPVTARNRERIRARLGVKYTYSDELSATIRLASGNPDDPISTNQTLGSEWTPKDINLNWAFLTFTPGATFGLRPGIVSATAGKFPNPMFRVGEMVWDDDLAPGGFSEKVALLAQPWGNLDQINLYAEQWTFNEISNGQDGWMFGGQINPQAHVGDVRLEAGIGQYGWLNPNQVAQALNTNSSLVNTNKLVKATTNGTTSIVGYKSAFNQTNLTLAATLPDVVFGQPLKLFTDYVYNWQGAGDDVQGVQAGVQLGQAKVRGDWDVAVYYEYLGREAAVSAFTNSDFEFGGTNSMGPVLTIDYQLLDPLWLTARSYFVNYIEKPPQKSNPTLVRLQLDAQVRF